MTIIYDIFSALVAQGICEIVKILINLLFDLRHSRDSENCYTIF